MSEFGPNFDINQDHRFCTSDGYAHAYRYWPAVGESRGVLLALHGIQSHSGWYTYSSERIAQAGYHVYFLDRRGSGHNFRQRGHAPHEDRLIYDVVQFASMLKHEHPTLPLNLLGLSWGGKLAAVTAARFSHLFSRLVLLYPGIRAYLKPKWYQLWQLKLAELAELEQKKIPIPLSDPALFTNNPEARRFIRNDPLVLGEVTTAFMFANRNLDYEARSLGSLITMPTLMMLAGQDRIINNEETMSFFNGLQGVNRRLNVYSEAAHTLEFEPNRDEIIADLVDWLQHSKASSEAKNARCV